MSSSKKITLAGKFIIGLNVSLGIADLITFSIVGDGEMLGWAAIAFTVAALVYWAEKRSSW
jgi:hypothetical protein